MHIKANICIKCLSFVIKCQVGQLSAIIKALNDLKIITFFCLSAAAAGDTRIHPVSRTASVVACLAPIQMLIA